MIEVSRVALERAILDGATLAGEWRLCKMDGLVYWAEYYTRGDAHTRHAYVRIPSLYPEGLGSMHRQFCAWAKKLPPIRAELLLSLARGTAHFENPDADAYAIPCIVAYWLTPGERAQWESHLADRINLMADACLIVLNNDSRRARFKFAYPTLSAVS